MGITTKKETNVLVCNHLLGEVAEDFVEVNITRFCRRENVEGIGTPERPVLANTGDCTDHVNNHNIRFPGAYAFGSSSPNNAVDGGMKCTTSDNKDFYFYFGAARNPENN